MPLAFDLNNNVIKLIQRIHNDNDFKIIQGKIATSDELPNQPSQITLLRKQHFDVIDMEGASFMQTCWFFQTSCVVIRGVSNQAGGSIDTRDVEKAANNAAQILIEAISK